MIDSLVADLGDVKIIDMCCYQDVLIIATDDGVLSYNGQELRKILDEGKTNEQRVNSS